MDVLGAQGWDLLARMVFGFLAAVAGVTLWAHTREPSWLFIVAATLVGYVEVLLRFLDALGVFSLDAVSWHGVPVVRIGFAVVVPLLYALGLWMGVRSFRKP